MNGTQQLNSKFTGSLSNLSSGRASPAFYDDVDRPVFREWAPLNSLLEKIPPRYHQGFVSKELVLTCVAVSCDSIVLGSSAGVIFWYNRGNQQVTRKSIDDKLVPVTCAAITLSQYGEALAVGNLQGTLAIFSSNPSYSRPICILLGKHNSPVTALTWDSRGHHLLSGEEVGRVLLSCFENGTLQSIKQILQEDTRIIQLRFHPLLENKIVLISSMKRVVIAEIDTSSFTQVGIRERKNPSTPFGADFGYAGNETVIFSSRPGLRLWQSDCKGFVQQTLIFGGKDAPVSQPRSKLILLSFQEDFGGTRESHFGPVHCLSNGLVFTYSTKSMFILDKEQINVFSSNRFNNAKTILRQATVFHNEIFLMLENRLVIRVSDRPDRSARLSASVDRPFLSITKSIKPTLQSTITKLAHKISDVSDMKTVQSSPYIMESLSSALAPLFESNKTVPVNRAAPPKALLVMPEYRSPSLSPCFQDTPSSSSPPSPPPLSPSYTEDDLLYGSYHQGRKRKLKLNNKSNTVESDQLDIEPQVPAMMEPWSRPDSVLANEDELKQELERKDQLLAELLQLDQPVNLDVPETPPDDHQPEEIAEIVSNSTTPTIEEEPAENDVDADDDFLSDNIYSKYAAEDIDVGVRDDLPYRLDVCLPDSTNVITETKEQTNGNDQMSFDEEDEEELTKLIQVEDDISKVPVQEKNVFVPIPSPAAIKKQWKISQLNGKSLVTGLTACRHYVVVVADQKWMYYQPSEPSLLSFDWLPVDTPANQLVVSSSGQLLWRLYKGTVSWSWSVNSRCPAAQSWTIFENGISQFGISQLDYLTEVAEDYIWMLHLDGALSFRSARTPSSVSLVEVPGNDVLQVRCLGNQILLLLSDGEVYQRSRVTSSSPMGFSWQRVNTPDAEAVLTMAQSPNNEQLWIFTRTEKLFFRNRDSDNHWWRVALPAELLLNKATHWLHPSISSLFNSSYSHYQLTLAVTESRIFLAIAGSSVILQGEQLIGYSWAKVDKPNSILSCGQTWRMMCCDQLGTFWLVDTDNRLYCYSRTQQLNQLALPVNGAAVIDRLTACAGHLWLLTTHGEIFIRTDNNRDWVPLSTLQFQPHNYLRHVSLGVGLAWACDRYGQVYFRSGSNGPPTLLSPAWITVDEQTVFFKQVCVGPSNLVVWALDSDGNTYVREGITRQFPIGTHWHLVEGIQATHLSISETAIWALSTSRNVYRRGITLGHIWEIIPGLFSSISVNADDTLWALDIKGKVCQLSTTFPLKSDDLSNPQYEDSPHLDDDWVLLYF